MYKQMLADMLGVNKSRISYADGLYRLDERENAEGIGERALALSRNEVKLLQSKVESSVEYVSYFDGDMKEALRLATNVRKSKKVAVVTVLD